MNLIMTESADLWPYGIYTFLQFIIYPGKDKSIFTFVQDYMYVPFLVFDIVFIESVHRSKPNVCQHQEHIKALNSLSENSTDIMMQLS